MVEMQETANILHTATSRSLVVLDEIGRGTSTFDGLNIAWAVAEYLATNHRARPKTLFATHYHELTDLADGLPGIVNAHVAGASGRTTSFFCGRSFPAGLTPGVMASRRRASPASRPAVVDRAKEIPAGAGARRLCAGLWLRPRTLSQGHLWRAETQQMALFAAPSEPDYPSLGGASHLRRGRGEVRPGGVGRRRSSASPAA